MAQPAPSGFQRIATWPLYPFLVALYPALSLIEQNDNRIRLDQTVVPIGALLLFVGFIYALLRLFIRDAQKAWAVCLVVVVMTTYYGLFSKTLGFYPTQMGLEWLVAAAWIGGFAGFAWAVQRHLASVATLAKLVNAFGLVIVAMPLFNIAFYHYATVEHRAGDPQALLDAPAQQARLDAGTAARDVYYIVFDRYASADQLAEVYDFDNRPFLRQLEASGFYVVDNAVANYPRTPHSLASSLNMAYLDGIRAHVGRAHADWVPVYRLMQDSRVAQLLQESGYRFVHLGSWWEPTRINGLADENVNWRDRPEMVRELLDRTLFGRLGDYIGLDALDDRQHQCERVRHKFDRLKALAGEPGPKFVFAHFLVPHPPFVLDREGRCIDAAVAVGRSRRDNYLDQLAYVNAQVLELIATIRAKTAREPIIVIQADEGPWPQRLVRDEIYFLGRDISPAEWTEASRAELREKMRILNALALPNGGAAALYDGITPVNTFRVIFNHYFGTDLPLLPDRNYVFESGKEIYRFTDVSGIVR